MPAKLEYSTYSGKFVNNSPKDVTLVTVVFVKWKEGWY